MTTIDADLPLHLVGQVASHNTYENTRGMSDWRGHLDNVNAVELDVYPQYNWQVSHLSGAPGGHLYIESDGTGYLPDLADWRDNWHSENPGQQHDLIFCFIEMKSSYGWRVSHFETILSRRFAHLDLFRPIDLARWGEAQGYAGNSLKELVATYGWPKCGDVALKDKVMFVVNGDDILDTYLAERPVVRNGKWNKTADAPTCFVMPNCNDEHASLSDIVITNQEYSVWSDAPEPPADRCLRRASRVTSGNDEMVSGHPETAMKVMADKKINLLAYDNTTNAFWIPFQAALGATTP